MGESQTVRPEMGLARWMFLMFVYLRLTGQIDWSWWWVASPLLLTLLLIIVKEGLEMFVEVRARKRV